MTSGPELQLPVTLQPTLPCFDENDLRNWFASVKKTYDLFRVPEDRIPCYIQNALPPYVRNAHIENQDKPWDEYIKALVQRFQPDNSWDFILDSISTMKPKAGESWRSFANRISSIADRADPKIPVKNICSVIMKVLPKSVASAMMALVFKTVPEFIDTVEHVLRMQKALNPNETQNIGNNSVLATLTDSTVGDLTDRLQKLELASQNKQNDLHDLFTMMGIGVDRTVGFPFTADMKLIILWPLAVSLLLVMDYGHPVKPPITVAQTKGVVINLQDSKVAMGTVRLVFPINLPSLNFSLNVDDTECAPTLSAVSHNACMILRSTDKTSRNILLELQSIFKRTEKLEVSKPVSSARPKRSMLPILGTILNWITGLATESQLNTVISRRNLIRKLFIRQIMSEEIYQGLNEDSDIDHGSGELFGTPVEFSGVSGSGTSSPTKSQKVQPQPVPQQKAQSQTDPQPGPSTAPQAPILQAGVYVCPAANFKKTYKTPRGYNKHQQDKHTTGEIQIISKPSDHNKKAETEFQCAVCRTTFKTEVGLARHQTLHRFEEISVKKPVPSDFKKLEMETATNIVKEMLKEPTYGDTRRKALPK
ncbi:Zinc finger protein 394 [Frankliniella fusca]|uniref:Zinc finger protein 394 n=1 Tax=Frankliniella fusca TaxID=407009 RepID=A0AAE1L6S1_9NEOP|nr:Zinc finger protein 394 [Frankliniella fusca]